ncbi:MAG: KH domain-containing protein [Christensenellales bacterium]|jgi:predicted RNA-binding protein YlqC (UPF0109 family)|nr:KH domain-containing protein [Clostridiales bacterium]
MKDLIDYLVKQLIEEEHHEIVVLEDEKNIEYKVYVDKEHIAKVIGKAGKTSKAIRTLVKACANGRDKNVSVYIEER